MYQNRLPLLCRMCCLQEVRGSSMETGENALIGSIRQGYVEDASNLFISKARREKKEEAEFD